MIPIYFSHLSFEPALSQHFAARLCQNRISNGTWSGILPRSDRTHVLLVVYLKVQ